MKESDRHTKMRRVQIQSIKRFNFQENRDRQDTRLSLVPVTARRLLIQLNTLYRVQVLLGIRLLERFSHALEVTWYKMEIKSRRYTLGTRYVLLPLTNRFDGQKRK